MAESPRILPKAASPAGQPPAVPPPTGLLAGVWLVLLVAIVGAGYLYHRQERAEFTRQTHAQLAAIADLKVAQIVQWRRERFVDADWIRATPYAARRALEVLAQPESRTTRQMFTGWLEPLLQGNPYERALLADAQLNARLVHPERAAGALSEPERRAAEAALRTREVVVADLHRATEGGHAHLSFAVPFVVRREGDADNVPAAGLPASAADRSAAVLVLQSDAREVLFPMIQSWPLASRSGETLLVRREGEEVVYLNDLRHGTNTALRLRFPLSRREIPDVRAALGEEGVMAGRDYRGVPVLAAMRKVPKTPWCIVAKVDEDEAFAPLRARAWSTALLVALLAVSASLAVAFFRHRQRLAFAQERLAEAHARQRTEEALRQSEEFNRRVIASSHDCIKVLDLDANLLSMSESGQRLLGITDLTRHLNHCWVEFWQETDRAQAREAVAAARAGTVGRFQAFCPSDTGEPRWWDVIVTPIGDAAGQPRQLLAVSRDVTERRQAEAEAERRAGELARLNAELERSNRAALNLMQDAVEAKKRLEKANQDLRHEIAHRQQAEERVRGEKLLSDSLINSLPGIFYLFDERGRFLRWNANFERVTGYTAAELAALSPLDLFAGEEQALIQQRIQAVFADGQSDVEAHLVSKSGGRTPYYLTGLRVEWNGQPCLLGVGLDITERKQAEAAVRESEARFRATFEQAAVGVALVAPDGGWLRVNQKLCDIVGYTREELLTRTFQDITHPEDLEKDLSFARQVLAGDLQNYTMEKRYFRKDGSIVWIDLTVSLVRELSGQPKYFIAVVEDITARQQAQEEIRRLNAELEQRVRERTAQLEASNKELEAFSYSVSHDLRAPLRAIDGFARILEIDYAARLDAEGQRVLAIVRNQARRMGQLIDELLRFSRLGRHPLKHEPLAPRTLVSRALDQLQVEQAGRQIDLTIGELPPCAGDAALLQQVWINLLSNALKYTGTRSRGLIAIGGRVENGEVIYFVQDNGVGFDMRYAGKLFGVFQRLHNEEEFEGIGVGLALVQRIVHRHGGRVWAEGELDRGATFYFALPHPTLLS